MQHVQTVFSVKLNVLKQELNLLLVWRELVWEWFKLSRMDYDSLSKIYFIIGMTDPGLTT